MDGSGFQEGIGRVNRALRLVQSEYRASAAQLGEFGSRTDHLNLQAGALARQINLQQQAVNALSTAHERTAAAQGADSRAAQDLQIRLNRARESLANFQNQLRSVNDELQRNSDEINDNARQAEQAGGHFAGLGGRIQDAMKGASLAIVGAFAAATAAITSAVVAASSELQTAMGRIESGTGVTGEDLQTLGGVAQDVFKKDFGESLTAVSDSVAVLRQNLGDMSKQEMADVLQGALTIEERFGAGVDETSKVVKTLTANFADLSNTQALDLITVGFQRGGDFAGDLLDTLNEYAPQFASMGMSAQEMLGILISGSEVGAFNLDKVGDAVKEFNIRAQDGSKTTAEGFAAIGLKADEMAQKISAGGEEGRRAFQATVTALTAMKDPVEQNTAGVNLFGSQWEDVRKSVIAAMQDAGEAVQDFDGATQRAGDALHNNLGSKMKQIWRQITVSIAQDNPFSASLSNAADAVMAHIPQIQAALGKVVDALNTAFVTIGQVISWAIDHADMLIPVLSGIAGWVTVAFAASKIMAAVTAIKAVGGAMAVLNATMLLNPWTIAIGALVAGSVLIYRHWDQIKSALAATWSWIRDTAATVFNGIKDFFAKWGPTIGVVLGGPIAWIGALIYKNWDAIKQKTQEVWNGISSFFAGIWNGIVGIFSSIWARISPPITALWSAVSIAFSVAWQTIQALVVGGWQNIVTIFTAAKETVMTYISGLWEAVKVIFATAFLVIYDLVTGKWGEIGGVFSAAGEKLRSIIGGVWNTIKGIWIGAFVEVQARTMVVWTYLTGLWESGMSSILSIASGVWESIKATWNNAINSVVTFVVNLYNGVTGWFSNLWSVVKQSVVDGWNAVYSFFASAPARAAAYVQQLKENIAAKWEQLKADAASAGSDFLEGFVRGVTDKIAYVRKKVEDTFNDVVGWAKKVLDIHSPSRVMQEIGQWTMEGFVVGMEDKESRAYQVVQAIGEGVQKALSDINLDMDITNTEYQVAIAADGIVEVDRFKLQLENLNIAMDASADRLANLNKAYNDTVYVLGENSEEARKLYLEILKEQKAQGELKKQISATNESIEAHAKELSALGDTVVDVSKKLKEDLSKAEEDYQSKVQAARQKEADEIAKVTEAYNSAFESRRKSLMDFAGLFDAVQSRQVSGEGLLQNLLGQNAAFEEWQASMAALGQRQGMDKGLLDELNAMGPKAGAELAALNKLTDEQLQQYVEAWRKKNELAKQQATKELSGLKVDTEKKIAEIRKSTETELSKLEAEWKASNAKIRQNTVDELSKMVNDASVKGAEFVTKLAESITAAMPDLVDAINGVGSVLDLDAGSGQTPAAGSNQAGVGQQGGNQSGASSKVAQIVSGQQQAAAQTIAIWKDARDKLADVWADMNTDANERMTEVGVVIQSAWQSIQDYLATVDLFSTGAFIMQGLVNGIDSMAGAVTSAAQRIADSVKGTIQGALDIHSPSRVTQGFGVNIGQGLVIGMDSMLSKVQEMSRRMAAVTTPNPDGTLMIGARAAYQVAGGTSAASVAGGDTFVFQFNAPVYGIDDLENQIRSMMQNEGLGLIMQGKRQAFRQRGRR